MKLIALLIMFAFTGSAEAKYFRLLDPVHPQINTGVSIHGDTTKSTTMLAVITHSAADGYLLIPNVAWTPLAVGGGFKNGTFHLAVGPSLNLLPAIQSTFLSLINAITAPDQYTNLKSILQTSKSPKGDIVGALGVNVEYDFLDKSWTTPLFAGVSWKF